MKKLFGTDGVRGVANKEPMTVEIALKLGRAAAYVFRKEPRRHRIVIGKDTRLSGYMLESALVAGITSMGVDVILVGPLPTPGIAFITRSLRADAGIVISASHNPYEDNGIKFFSGDGFKLPDNVEVDIENLVSSGKIDSIRPTATEIGKAYKVDDAVGRYVEFLKNSFPKDLSLEGFKISLDCANGAAYKVAPKVFRELGADVEVLCNEPNGQNINLKCGSLYPDVVQKSVVEFGSSVGVSLDGDADRVIFSDECGKEVDGDQIMALCALDLSKRNLLKSNTIVATVMSNIGLESAMNDAGIKLVRTGVGDRYVLKEMLELGCNLGGEQSGHMIFLDHNTTGDGTLSALQVIATVIRSGKPLSELASCMRQYPQVLINIDVKEKKKLEDIPSVVRKISEAEKKLGNDGRVLVRYSGTQNMIRVMLEGKEAEGIKKLGNSIADEVKREIGV